jgi:hypothetical protein
MTYRYHSAIYEISVQKDPLIASSTIALDGEERPLDILLADDGKTHRVTVRIPSKPVSSRNVANSARLNLSEQTAKVVLTTP